MSLSLLFFFFYFQIFVVVVMCPVVFAVDLCLSCCVLVCAVACTIVCVCIPVLCISCLRSLFTVLLFFLILFWQNKDTHSPNAQCSVIFTCAQSHSPVPHPDRTRATPLQPTQTCAHALRAASTRVTCSEPMIPSKPMTVSIHMNCHTLISHSHILDSRNPHCLTLLHTALHHTYSHSLTRSLTHSHIQLAPTHTDTY